MANLFDNSQSGQQPLVSRPLNTPSRPISPPPPIRPAVEPKPPAVPPRFTGNDGAPQKFDRGDKPFQTPPPPAKTVNYTSAGQASSPIIKPRPAPPPIRPTTTTANPSYRPFTATPIPPKRMVSSGTTSASRFQTPPAVRPPAKAAPVVPQPARPTIPPTAKTILPPKGFRSQHMSPALVVIIIVVAAIVAAGLVGYFVFPQEIRTAYHQGLVTVGIEKVSPLTTVPPETISTTPKLASLDDITFTETTDPASGTAVAKGERITYTLTLHNTAQSDLGGLSISDTIPPATERLTVLSTPTGSKDNSTETAVEIANISLASGQTQLIRFQVTVKSDLAAGTTFTNTATLAMNGSRKISNNNTPSSLALAATPIPTVTPVPDTTPVITPVVTPAPTATPSPTATPTPTPTLTPTVTPTPTATAAVTPTVTPAPEETADRAAPEDRTTVKTGGDSLTYLFVFIALTIIASITLIFVRRKATE